MPLVSIIMGVYNAEDTIDRCIESIRNQTYTNWEFIICDDCSTDNTLERLLKLSKEEDRIHILRNRSNQRLAASLNHCLSKASGKYVARMDADDYSLKDRILKQVQFMESHNAIDVVGTAAYIFDGKDKTDIRLCPEYPETKDLVMSTPYIHPSIMMRKNVYDELHGYTVSRRTVRGQDLDLWYRFYEKGFRGYNMQEPLLVYHETIDDYKKRSVESGLLATKTNIIGLRRIKSPLYTYVFALRPLVSSLLPPIIMKAYHKQKSKRNNCQQHVSTHRKNSNYDII